MRQELSRAAPARNVARTRRERGQSMVEMAFVLPLFLVVIMATVDFGFAFQRYITLTNAAREGARFGAVSGEPSADSIITETEKRLDGNMKTNSDISASCKDGGVEDWACPRGSEVSVRIEHDYEFVTPLGGLLNVISAGAFPNQVSLASETTMRRE